MTSARALANQEREAQVQRIGRIGHRMLILIATILSFVTIGLLTADQLYRPQAFAIDQLKIKGKFRYMDPNEIQAVVMERSIGNFFSVNLDEIKSRVETLPWVQSAQVRREWPNTLQVSVSEHRPVMRWQKDQWVNALGQVINVPKAAVNIKQPVVLSGNKDDAELILHNAFLWQKRLSQDGLELRRVSLSGSHAWTLSLYHGLSDSSFELLLGRIDASQRLERFRSLFDKRFSNSNQRLQRVDARYPDGLAINAISIPVQPDDFTASKELAVN